MKCCAHASRAGQCLTTKLRLWRVDTGVEVPLTAIPAGKCIFAQLTVTDSTGEAVSDLQRYLQADAHLMLVYPGAADTSHTHMLAGVQLTDLSDSMRSKCSHYSNDALTVQAAGGSFGPTVAALFRTPVYKPTDARRHSWWPSETRW